MKKLTQEVFDLPECPEWAVSAAVDASGGAWFYSVEKDDLRLVVTSCKSEQWSCIHINNATCDFIGQYDTTNWQQSAIDRGEE